tara:strand:+ start:1479 stop:1712 length:234 start_codon:yes stop_codon:yes gene_type:complete
VKPIISAIGKLLKTRLDITEVFKTKGDLKRWSAKRTLGGVIVVTACAEIANTGLGWEAVALCAIGILPLCLSFLEKK